MTEETASDIILRYPDIFGKPPFDPMKTLVCFGFEVSKFWIPILSEGFKEINQIVQDQKIKDFRITQVKEKFGSLRIYSNFYTDEIDAVIDKMEDKVSTICEKCGSPEGKFRQDGWLRVECDSCFAKAAAIEEDK